MINSYCVDLIDIIDSALDDYGGVTGTSTQQNVKCKIEDYGKIILNSKGQEVIAETIIFVPGTYTVQFKSRIKLKKRAGVTFQNADKEYAIKKLNRPHGFGLSGWEIYL